MSVTGRFTIEKTLAWALTIALAAVVCWLAAGTLRWGLVHDAPILQYIASRILAGDVPYRDLWDMNFPGVYLIHMFELSVLGRSDAAWRAFDLLVLAAIIALMVLYCRRLGWLCGILGGAVFAAFHFTNGPTVMGQRDYLLVLPLLAAGYGLLVYRESRGSLWALALASFAAGAAVMIKPHAGVFALALAILVTWVAWRDRRSLVRAWLTLVIAGLAPAVLIVGWLWFCGALPAFVEIVFDYTLPLYSNLSNPHLWQRLSRLAERASLLWPLLPLAGLSLVVVGWARRINFAQSVLLVGLVCGAAHFFLQGKWWLYQAYPAAGFFCLATLSFANTLVEHRSRVVRIAFLCGLIALVANVGWRALAAPEPMPQKWQQNATLIRQLRSELSPEDTIQVFDTAEGGMQVLFGLNARQPTRLIYDFPIFAHDPKHPYVRALRQELLRGLRAHPPRFILVFQDGWPKGGYERVQKFRPLSLWIERRYGRPRPYANCRVYKRKRE